MKPMIFYLSFIAATAFMLAGCDDFDETKMQFDNAAYLDIASERNSDALTFNNLVADFDSAPFSVVLGYPAQEEVTASLKIDPSRAASYNARNGTSYATLDAGHYSLSAEKVTVAAGKTVSEPVVIHFTGMDRLEMDETYLCPLTITGASMRLLDGSSTMYFLVKRSSAITVAAELGPGNWIGFPTLDKNSENSHKFNGLTAVTYEALIFIDDFLSSLPGQSAPVNISSVMGVEQYLLLRIGDTNFERRQLQFDGSGSGSAFGKFPKKDDAKLLNAGQWYHVACTYDQQTRTVRIYVNGRLQSEGTEMGVLSSDKKINLAMRALYDLYLANPQNPAYAEYSAMNSAYQFFIGRSYDDYRPLNGKIAEARVWSVARTPEQIWEHMYDVPDPENADGLIGYWKFNEGSGNVVKDWSGNGNDGVAANDIIWPSGIEIPQINKE